MLVSPLYSSPRAQASEECFLCDSLLAVAHDLRVLVLPAPLPEPSVLARCALTYHIPAFHLSPGVPPLGLITGAAGRRTPPQSGQGHPVTPPPAEGAGESILRS